MGREIAQTLPIWEEMRKFSLGYIPYGDAPPFGCPGPALARFGSLLDVLALKGVHKRVESLKARVPLRACVCALKGGILNRLARSKLVNYSL